jgi:tRNA pseudouridine55 synthase
MDKDLCGILVVDKEKDMTSHDVVAMVRRRFSIKKVGHAGTLDPNATGVLVLLLGKATKLSSKYLGSDKEYAAIMKLGEKTSTADAGGEVTESLEVNVTKEEVTNIMKRFEGEILQVPPMVSAKKIKGKRLYKLARQGITIEREPVKVKINHLEITSVDLPLVAFKVSCSKGTYVRQLAEDIGEGLGCGAHLAELRRTVSGEFSIEEATTVTDLKAIEKENLEKIIIPCNT